MLKFNLPWWVRPSQIVISQFFVDAPCPCRRPHRLPIDPSGKVSWACSETGRSYDLQLNAKTFDALQLNRPTDAQVAAEGVCIVHTAAPRGVDEQRCSECDALLLSYRGLVRRVGSKRLGNVRWWLPGALVGVTKNGAAYLARGPMSVGRERRCFETARTH